MIIYKYNNIYVNAYIFILMVVLYVIEYNGEWECIAVVGDSAVASCEFMMYLKKRVDVDKNAS